jgi:pimeloyl-ACP methyl ester carboxylesterase
MFQRPLIVFIHGTWSNFTIWDWMENQLHARFPNQFDFDRVGWSGGNSASARAEGVRNFEALAAERPDPPLFIISHSHGANVVLQSADHVRNRVKLLICLNSPILSAKRFRLPLPISIALWVLSIIFGIAAASWNLGALPGLLGSTGNFDNGPGLVTLAGAIGLAAILFYVANTWGAFLLLGVFALFAFLMTASSIDPFQFFEHSLTFHDFFSGA